MIIKIINDQMNLIGSGGQHRILSFAEALHRVGVKVVLVTPYFKVDYDHFKNNFHKFYIDREYLYSNKNKMKFMFDNTIRLLLNELDDEPPDAYIIGLPVPLLRGLVRRVAIFRKIPYIVDFGDPWFSPGDPLLWRWLMDSYLVKLLKEAPAITVPNRWFRAHLKTMISNMSILEKIHIVYPAALYIINSSVVDERDYSIMKFVHLGGVPPTLVENIINMFKNIYYKRKINIEFTIIGDQKSKDLLEQRVREKGLGSVVRLSYSPPVSRDKVYELIKHHHFGLSVHEGLYWKPINELKIIDYLASGLIVVSTLKTDLLIENINSIFSNDLSDVHEKIPYDKEKLIEMSLNGLLTTRNCCHIYKVSKRIITIINKILN